jgi:hypothetical protein
MTKLVVEELKTSLKQTFRTNTRLVLQAVRPHIYKHLSPAGDLTLNIIQDGKTVGTKTVTSAIIESGTDSTPTNYYHGIYTLEFDNQVVVNEGEFEIELVGENGYSFSESAYFGWVKPHEDLYIETEYTPAGDDYNPFGVQLWKWL